MIERDAATLARVEVKAAATIEQTDFKDLRLPLAARYIR